MLRKSKFRLPKKSSRKSKPNLGADLPAVNEILQLRLSPEVQEYVKCRIGEEIYGDNNWVLVKKAAILASLELSDDFLTAVEAVHEYPEDSMLIGSYGFDQNISEDYQLCTTVQCKNNTLAILELRRRRIEQIYNMPVYAWTSLGSELEVLSMQNYNLRSLLVVEIDSIFPIFTGNRLFTFRVANDSVYVECYTDRHEYKNVWRRRVDTGSQACTEKSHANVQTREATDVRHYTQYEEQIQVQEPTPEIANNIVTFLDKHLLYMENILQLNYHIHLYTNDYSDFLNPYVPQVYTNYQEIVACQDIKKCQGKQVSCVSWNPFISGLFVASYVHTSFDYVFSAEPEHVDTETFSDHVALVWSFSDMQKPKLYLHSKREITQISCCPYDENLIVGGCSNGQIVIWDINRQISKVENKVILTPVEQDNQMHITKLIFWMKIPPNMGHVDPAVISSIQHGHKTPVTSITWIPPEYYISSTGQYSKTINENDHMQFFTTSLEDNNICVWDLKHCQNVKKTSRRKPLQRLNRTPSALHSEDSPLKKKHYVFIPIFVLILKDPSHIHIRGMLFKHFNNHYEKYNSVQVGNNYEREFYKRVLNGETFDSEQSFLVNTVSGMLYDCSWDGFTYDHGNKINFDTCHLKSYALFHDAPVKMCVANRDDPEVFLSVGGKVFAIWHRRQTTPIIWRKCTSLYIFGMWSHASSFEILLFTGDGFIQLWNFFLNSKFPTYTVRCHGLPPVGIHSNIGVEHYLRNAILLCDRFGAIRIHTAGTELASKSVKHIDAHESIKTFMENKKQVQNCVAFWCNRFKRKKRAEFTEEVHTEKGKSIAVMEIQEGKKKEEISKEEEFEKKQAKYMYEQLTEYKNIHLNQLEMNTAILNKVIQHNNELGRKCAQVLSKRDELFEKKKRRIVWNPKKLEKKVVKISVNKESAIVLKKQYFEDYLLLEKQYVHQMKEYKFEFDWKLITEWKIHRPVRKGGFNPQENQAFNYNFRETIFFKTVDLYDN